MAEKIDIPGVGMYPLWATEDSLKDLIKLIAGSDLVKKGAGGGAGNRSSAPIDVFAGGNGGSNQGNDGNNGNGAYVENGKGGTQINGGDSGTNGGIFSKSQPGFKYGGGNGGTIFMGGLDYGAGGGAGRAKRVPRPGFGRPVRCHLADR